MKFKIKRILSVLLVLCMMMGMLPNMLMTAHAASNADAIESITINGITITGDDLNGTISESESDWTWKYSGTGAPIITLNNYNGGAISVKGETGASAVHIYINANGTCNISSNSTAAVMLEAEDTGSINFQLGTGSSLTMKGWDGVNNASKKNPSVTFEGSGKVSIEALGGYGIIAEQSDGEISTVGTVTVTEGTELVATAPGYVARYGVSRTTASIHSVGLVVKNGAGVKFVSTGADAAISSEEGHYDKIVEAAGYTKSLSADGKTFMLYKPTVVSEIGVKDITVPVVGETPDYSATTCGNGYEIKDIDWSYYDETISNEDLRWVTMNSGDTFKPGEKYLCTVEVVPSWNATFPDAKADLSAEFNDENANISPVYDASKAYVEKEFTVPHAYVDQPDDVSVYVNKKAPVTFTFSDGAKFGCVEYEVSEGVWQLLDTFDHTAIEANTAATIEIPAKGTAQIQNYRIKLQATSDSKIYISDEFTVEWKEDTAVAPTKITDVNATVVEPVVGGTPSTTAATTGTDYTVFVSGWYDEEENTVSVFEAGKTYTLEVGFTPKEGYVLAGSNTLNATINDKEAEYLSLNTINGTVTCFISYTIPAVAPTEITDVNATVAEPVVGGTPSTTAATTGTDYTVFVSGWYDEEENTVSVFEAGKTYTLEVGFTPKEGYVLAGSNTLNATINDKEAEYLSLNTINGTVTCFISYTIPAVVPTEYDITVNGGTASVGAGTAVTKATAGTEITLTVDESAIPAGKVFDKWEVVSGGVTITDGKFTMPESAVEIKATYKDAPVIPTEYDITVTGGTASANKAVAGTVITLTVDESAIPAGKVFDKWEVVSGGVTITDGKFTMPESAVEIKATYKDAPVSHTCDIKPVAKDEPSCTEGGKEAYYKCEGCGKFYEDALGAKEITDLANWGNLPKLGHTESDWKSDKDNHWKECTVTACGVIIEDSKAAHKDDNKDGKCDVCEYNVGLPTTPDDDKPNDNPQTGDNSNMFLWIALLFISGAGVVATTVFGKKKFSVK